MPRALAQPEPRSQKVGMRAGFDEPSGWSADARCIAQILPAAAPRNLRGGGAEENETGGRRVLTANE
jgi:hypothetical protein